MSTSQKNYTILHSPQANISPLYPPLSTLTCSRFNPRHTRASLQTCLTMSPNVDLSSPEITGTTKINSLRASNRSRRAREPNSSTFRSQQFRHDLETRLREEVGSPSVMEPLSSSSQPSEPLSGSYNESSPFQVNRMKREGQDNVFTEEFYQRINDYLDSEGLEVVDQIDQMQGIRFFSKSMILDGKDDGQQGGETCEIKGVQSATHSPKLISDNLFSSTLLQRRSSRSQGPGNAMSGLDSLKKARQGKLSLNVFRHFKDDLNQIMQTASPIEEKMTPVISRNNSGLYENTPDRLGPKQYSFKHLMSPNIKENEDPRFKNGLAKYTIKVTQSFKSPKLKIQHTNSINEINSPLRSAKEDKDFLVFSSSPVLAKQSSSPCRGTPSDQLTRLPRHIKGNVVRKSRFQALRELQECPPMN